MSNELTLPKKPSTSHKGESGVVTIVAGSYKYYGSPILCALGAEVTGTDLITLYLPTLHLEAAKNYSLNFFLKDFVAQTSLGLKDIGLILENANKAHALIIGPGLGTDDDTKRAIQYILAECRVPCVIDAEALFPEILNIKQKSPWIITPHQGEFKRLFDLPANETTVFDMAKKYNLTILCKAPIDFIASNEELYLNKTGCPEMRIGGTGDVLAGIVGALVSLGLTPFAACKTAVHHYGLAGESLKKSKRAFTSFELAKYFAEQS